MKSLISFMMPQGWVPPTTNGQLVRAEPFFIAVDDPQWIPYTQASMSVVRICTNYA